MERSFSNALRKSRYIISAAFPQSTKKVDLSSDMKPIKSGSAFPRMNHSPTWGNFRLQHSPMIKKEIHCWLFKLEGSHLQFDKVQEKNKEKNPLSLDFRK